MHKPQRLLSEDLQSKRWISPHHPRYFEMTTWQDLKENAEYNGIFSGDGQMLRCRDFSNREIDYQEMVAR